MKTRHYIFFLCGQLGMMVLARYFFQWIIRYAQVGGQVLDAAGQVVPTPLFAAAAVGLLFFAFRIFDGVTDPIAGGLSDGWVRAGHERRRLLWFSFCIPSVGLILVFAPNTLMAPGLRWTLLGLGMFLFFVGYTLYAIPYWSLIDDYSGDDEARKRHLSNLLGAGVLAATAIGFIVSPIVVGKLGFFKGAIAFAVPALFLMILPFFADPKDGADPSKSTPDHNNDFWEGFRTAIRHRKFIAIVLIFAGSQMSFTVLTAASPFLATSLLGGTDQDVAKLMGPFILTALPSFFLIPMLSKRFGWKPLIIWATVLLAAVYCLMSFLGVKLIGSPITTAAIIFGLCGPLAAVLLALEGEAVLACAREKEGNVTSVYFGVYNFIVKAMNGLALSITGWLGGLALAPETGIRAVRAMPVVAGGLLALGLVFYFWIRPRSKTQ